MTDMEKNPSQDWDLSEDYYQESTPGKELRLEDFIENTPEILSETEPSHTKDIQNPVLETGRTTAQQEIARIAQLVRQATDLSCQGRTAASIAEELGVTEQYIKDILICVQSFPEDNPVAVAHLMMG